MGAAGSECDTATRLLAPTHFAKVDQGILPVMDYLHIHLTEESGVIDTAESMGIQQGEGIVLSMLS